MSNDQTYQSCLQAFVNRDYPRCAEQALALARTGTDHVLLQVLLISLQRLGRTDLLEQLAPQALATTAREPWCHALVQLTLGERAPQDVLRLAQNESHRCQVLFYSGSRFLTLGQVEAAHDAFEACLQINVSCVEYQLAQFEKEAPPPSDSQPAGGDPLARITQLNQQAGQLFQQGRYEQGIEVATEVVVLIRQHLGENHSAYASSLGNLGAMYKSLGRYAEAEPLFQQAVEIQRRTGGENDRGLAVSLHNLSVLYEAMGQFPQAESLCLQALEIRRRGLGEEHPDYAASLNGLASIYEQMGKHAQAEALYQQAITIRRKTLGDEHPGLAESLNNLGVLYHAMGRYLEAEPPIQEALAIRKKALGEGHPDFAQTLNNLAVLYRVKGDYRRAEPLYQQALQLVGATVGEEHPFYSSSLSNLGLLYKAMGNYEAAEPLICRALELDRKLLGEKHPDFVNTLDNLADLYEEKGKYAEAESLCRQAVHSLRRSVGEEHPLYAASLARLGNFHQRKGDYQAAESLYQQALEIDRRALGETHSDLASDLDSLAALHHAMGRYAQADRLYHQALKIRQQALGENNPAVATTLNNLAVLSKDMGNFSAAEAFLRKALEIRRAALGESHPDLSVSLNTLAEFHRELGHYAEAEKLYWQVLEIRQATLGEEHPRFANALGNLATLSSTTGNYPTAQILHLKALEIRRKALGENHPDVASTLHNLVTVHTKLNNLAEAESLCRQALQMRRQVLGENHPDVASSLHNLAAVQKARGNYAAAEPLFRQALELRRTLLGESHPDVATTLEGLAILCVATGRAAEGLTLLQQVGDIEDRILGEVFGLGSETQRMAFLQMIPGTLAGLLSLVLQHFQTSPAAVQAALDQVLRRKGLGAEALAVQRDAVLAGKDPALAPRFRELAMLRAQIGRKMLAGPGPEGPAAHHRALQEWISRKEELEGELARQIPEMNLQKKLHVNDRRAVLQALPKGSALVEFVRFRVFDFQALAVEGQSSDQPARYLAFVVPSGQPDHVQMIDLGEAEAIDRLIALFRAAVTQPPENRPDRSMVRRRLEAVSLPEDPGQLLQAAVFDPLRPALNGHARLLLSADGNLTRLPFAVLPDTNGKLLMDNYQISYVNTGRDVLRFGAVSSEQPSAALVCCDPDFDLAHTGATEPQAGKNLANLSRDLPRDRFHFGRLDGTRAEGERIATLLGVQPWADSTALEGRLKKECRSPRILHLATHGFFLEDQPRDPNAPGRELSLVSGAMGRLSGPLPENPLLRSGLALAGANTFLKGGTLPDEAEDGLLTAEDVSGLDLLSTELVVLSACETGLGEVKTGEGVFGLQRAFTLAGARTLVMSLWSVPDEQTRELMEDFYQRLLRGEGKADALRNAQLALRQKYPDPYYWGAFICQGNPAPLRP
jgi:tetratricopeptide (TPR) repeat protein/CHAT domain-containing protein